MSNKRYVIDNKELMKEWDWEKNNLANFNPYNITLGSNKMIFWKCKNCNNEWQASVHNRNKGTSCPVCSKNSLSLNHNKSLIKKRGSLFDNYPSLADEWDYEKNLPLTPNDVTSGSSREVWWICNQGHKWEAKIYHRVNGSGCIYCAGQKSIVGVNDLTTTNPELIQEWDWEKNINLNPNQFKKNSNIKVWWKCPLGHSWKTSINHRTSGTGCPHCFSENQTSFAEQSIVYYLSKYTIVENRKQFDGNEIDVFLPKFQIGFEYDGFRYHNSDKSKKKENEKNLYFKNNGIILYRIKESNKFEFDANNNVIFCVPDNSYNYMEKVMRYIENILGLKFEDIDISKDRIKIYNQYIQSVKANSLAVKYPHLIKEWNYEKNQGLIPENFLSGSNKKVWWKCLKCNSDYIATISHRASGTNCPYCVGKKVNETNNLISVFSELKSQWDYKKNDNIKPTELYYGSKLKVWWICQNCHSSYLMAVCSKIKSKTNFCPQCIHKHIGNKNRLKSIKENESLFELNPPFISEWDYEKNIHISPKELTVKSGIKVWWKCNKCGNEWQTTVYNRYSGTGCPECSKKSVASKRQMKINVYSLDDLSFYGTFESAQKLCEHFDLDFHKQAGNISAICHRKNKSLIGKYVLRYEKDDEFKNNIRSEK